MSDLKYRPEIDGLRTVAVLSVIIYHAEFTLGSQHLLMGGYLGVDIFFVISGFLITSLIISELHKTGCFSTLIFYERRARRLLPALLTVMLVSLPFAWKYLYPTQLVDFSKSLISSLFFGSNFYWHEALQEYGAESGLIKPFLHTWSLAIEEQYYIIFPWVLIALYRWSKKHIFAILMAVFFLSLQLAESMTPVYGSFSFYMLPSRFWELIAGGLLAHILYFHPQKDNDLLLNKTMPFIGLFFIIYSVIFIAFNSNHPGYITMMPVLGTILIIWFANKKNLVIKVLSNKLLAGTGLISYSLYLWHYPIFAFSRIRNFDPSTYDKLGWIILTLILSVVTYYLIEKPFRNRQKISGKAFFISLLGALLMLGSYSFYSIQNGGVRERFPELIAIYGKNEFDNKKLQSDSWRILNELAQSQGLGSSEAQKPSEFESEHLWFSNSPTTKKILIIGNSHSKDLFNTLYQNRAYFSDLEFARFGMANVLFPNQVDALYKSPNFIKADIVIIAFRYGDITLGRIPRLIESIKSSSKDVVLVLSINEFNEINGKPVFDGYIESLFQNPSATSSETPFSASNLKKLFFTNQSHVRDEINKSLREIAKAHDVVLLDKTDFICDAVIKTCDGITDDGFKSFYDYGHFTLE
ncbi:MAG: acyltransferase, partial [Anaerolineae bacterium]|nr:acyltransferase [Anaerolineae bacterium]